MQKLVMLLAAASILSTLYADTAISPSALAGSIAHIAGTRQYNPIGVASYGLTGNRNGSNFTAYEVVTNGIYGCANISSMYAYNASSPQDPYGHGASMQLNVHLVVNSTNASRVYWLQNLALFDTNSMLYSAAAEVFNGSNSSSSIFLLTPKEYALPFAYCPVIKVGLSSGYPLISFGYISNGSVEIFSNVSIDTKAESAYLLVTPYRYTSKSAYYDAELVFGGSSEAANATFSRFSASDVWIFYDSNGTFKPFPSAYAPGLDTAEGTDDLQVNPSNDYASIGIGKPNLMENIVLAGSGNNTIVYNGTSNPEIHNESKSGGQSHTVSNGMGYVGFALAVALILFAAWIVLRHRARRRRRP